MAFAKMRQPSGTPRFVKLGIQYFVSTRITIIAIKKGSQYARAHPIPVHAHPVPDTSTLRPLHLMLYTLWDQKNTEGRHISFLLLFSANYPRFRPTFCSPFHFLYESLLATRAEASLASLLETGYYVTRWVVCWRGRSPRQKQ